MDVFLFLSAALLGFVVAVPVGPIALLVVRRTLARGRAIGLATGLGAALADALCGAAAAAGLGAIAPFIARYERPMAIVGGVILLVIALRTWVHHGLPVVREVDVRSVVGAALSSLALTLTNPLTILGFAAAFAAFGLPPRIVDLAAGMTVVAGVFVGSAVYWVGLSLTVATLRGRLSPTTISTINRGAALALLGFAVYAFLLGFGPF